jgi:hypothetical protein
MQLLAHGSYEIFENPHLVVQFSSFSLLRAVRNEPLHGVSRKVRNTARTGLFTHADELTEFVFRYPEVN